MFDNYTFQNIYDLPLTPYFLQSSLNHLSNVPFPVKEPNSISANYIFGSLGIPNVVKASSAEIGGKSPVPRVENKKLNTEVFIIKYIFYNFFLIFYY